MNAAVEELRSARRRGVRPCAPFADLRGANLSGADLSGADLRYANLWGAVLRGADHGILRIDGLPSCQVTLVPTCDGWDLTIGCWDHHTLDDLRRLIDPTSTIDWPDATGAERERRRPLLAAALAVCEAHTVYHADALAAVAHWANTESGDLDA